ncbi:hypothetical protein [Massilia sp. CF038]|uniref:hypothetical protein n=1 Tax=Massilia sp. CF038 TaxID=1881045 RepID=UPI000912E933|nr:hypothetical protein [Massilia sp. CF038]SHH66577.1 hypothetical protein SAMN05428948_4833 [Massilia sp. CF038]
MAIHRLTRIVLVLVATALAACGGGSSSAPAPAPSPTPATADISVLMFGNSHTDANGLPTMLAAMLRAGRPGKTVAVVNAPGYLFLDERLNDAASMNLFNSRKWNAVVLQAQRYSSSGNLQYSSAEAVELVRRTRLIPALPVMFPEWPRRGIDETQRIVDLHVSIATRQPACVAPIPQAFDLAAVRYPALVLHAADGNHAAPAGSFLAAVVLYATLTGNAPLALPALDGLGVDSATQASLRAVADDQVKLTAPRLYCPNDGPL